MPELSEIVVQINEEHTLISLRAPEMLKHAIRCGELLIDAQKLVPKGQWVEWLNTNVDIFRTTAFKYMRLAANKDKLPKDINGIDPAIEFLQGKRQLSPEEKAALLEMAKQKRTYAEIQKAFGVNKATISYHVNSKDRNRTKQLQRAQRARERKALESQKQQRLVKVNANQLVAEAYSLIRKAEQLLSRRLEAELDWHEKRYITEAIQDCYRAEDNIGAAVKGKEHAKD